MSLSRCRFSTKPRACKHVQWGQCIHLSMAASLSQCISSKQSSLSPDQANLSDIKGTSLHLFFLDTLLFLAQYFVNSSCFTKLLRAHTHTLHSSPVLYKLCLSFPLNLLHLLNGLHCLLPQDTVILDWLMSVLLKVKAPVLKTHNTSHRTGQPF